ncbi:DUF722 domain-containing protein [Marinilactibacillus kalidii]|uniref:DUF722 domain-containing protein n=1 Tax=Marinilactibacillus kalidii TaxID=2820274 RepID=UPI001ABDA1D4|nr:DUF722 domain-containing protein [Marinilactibacillus kalidii]
MKGIYGWVEQKLQEYASIDHQIEERKLALEYSSQYAYGTEKVQSSKKRESQTENLVIKWETDRELIRMKRQKATIGFFLEEQEPIHYKLIELRYLKKERASWLEISEEIGYHEKWCMAIRKQLLEELANRLAWMVDIRT